MGWSGYLQLSVSQGKRSCVGGWLRGTGEKGRSSSWSGGSEETLLLSPSSLITSLLLPSPSRESVFSSDLPPEPLPKPMQNPRSLLDIFVVLSRKVYGFGASPRLKASSIGWFRKIKNGSCVGEQELLGLKKRNPPNPFCYFFDVNAQTETLNFPFYFFLPCARE